MPHRCLSSLELTAAPMEGLTTVVFRKIHAEFFGAADRYYLPFVTPTIEPRFTERQMRELSPQANAGIKAIPQLLTRRAEDFLWAAHALAELGYDEVNLNLGCPAGTVVAKGKGAGFLGDPIGLREFFDRIFAEVLPIKVSVKTRLGLKNPEEFPGLVELYNLYPISRLIVHPRIKTDLYKGDARREVLLTELPNIRPALGYNGDIVTLSDLCSCAQNFSGAPGGLVELMVGRALMADPALFRKARGKEPAGRDEILAFHNALFDAYAALFGSRKNAMMRMKEYWFFQLNLFGENDEISALQKSAKELFRTREIDQFQRCIRSIIDSYALLSETRYGWRKTL